LSEFKNKLTHKKKGFMRALEQVTLKTSHLVSKSAEIVSGEHLDRIKKNDESLKYPMFSRPLKTLQNA
jgi:hypothetical protein